MSVSLRKSVTRLRSVPRLPIRRPPIRLLWLIAAWPIIVGIWTVLVHRDSAGVTGDGALLGLDLHAIGDHAVLTGSYSRFWFHHPGPAYQYVLFPFYFLWPGAWSPHLISGVLNGIWVAIGMWAAGRSDGGRGRFLAAATFSILIAVLPVAATTQSWNASIGLLGASALLLVMYSHVQLPSRATLLTIILLSSFLMQAHVSWVPILLPALGVTAAFRCYARTRRNAGTPAMVIEGNTIIIPPPTEPPPSLMSRTKLATAAAWILGTLFLWLAPLIDFFTRHPNNVDELRFRAETLPRPTDFKEAFILMLGQLSRPVGFLLGYDADPQGGSVGAVPKGLTLLLLFGIVFAAFRWNDLGARIGVSLVGATALGMTVGYTRMTDNPIPIYLGRLGGAALAVLLIVLMGRVLTRAFPLVSIPLAIGLLLVLISTSWNTSHEVSEHRAALERHPEVPALSRKLPRTAIVGLGDIAAWEAAAGIANYQALHDKSVHISTDAASVGTPAADTAKILFRPWDLTERAPQFLVHVDSAIGENETVIATSEGVTLTRVAIPPSS